MNVVITKTLLDKKPEERTDEENKAVENRNQYLYNLVKITQKTNDTILNDCKILMSGAEEEAIPCTGWVDEIRKMCYAIETMNYEFQKYGLKCVLGQSKSKFGELRFYADVVQTPVGLKGKIYNFMSDIFKKLDNIDYRKERVVIEQPQNTVRLDLLDEETYNKNKDHFEVVRNGKGDLFRVVHCSTCGKYETKINSHKFLWNVRNFIDLKRNNILSKYKAPTNIEVYRKFFKITIDSLIDNTTEQLKNKCEQCGNYLVVDPKHPDLYYTKCQQMGWIKYLCRGCALACGNKYKNMADSKIYIEEQEVVDDKKTDGGSENNNT